MDIITYIPNLTAFREEALQKALNGDLGFSADDELNISYNAVKIPVHYAGDESLCLLRLTTREELAAFDSIASCVKIGKAEKVNGELRYVFDSDADQATYERVRGPLEYNYKDENGETMTAYKPYMIGGFA